MHELNSMILEGTVVSKPEKKPNFLGVKTVQFPLHSVRVTSVQDVTVTESFTVTVEIPGERLGETSMEYLDADRKVRVVGRFSLPDPEHPVIIAEHVEFRPGG